MLCLEAISYRYQSTEVLSNCWFSANRGEACLVVGANGAGKSTLLGIIAGLKRPLSGTRSVAATDISALRFVGHELMLYGQLTVAENLRLFSRVMRIPGSVLDDSLKRWGLWRYRDERVNALSRGLRVRVSLVRAFSGSASLIVLDEPSGSLDDGSAKLLVDQIRASVEQGATCIIATHDVARLEAAASRVALLGSGRIIADGLRVQSQSSQRQGVPMQSGATQSFEQVLNEYRISNR